MWHSCNLCPHISNSKVFALSTSHIPWHKIENVAVIISRRFGNSKVWICLTWDSLNGEKINLTETYRMSWLQKKKKKKWGQVAGILGSRKNISKGTETLKIRVYLGNSTQVWLELCTRNGMVREEIGSLVGGKFWRASITVLNQVAFRINYTEHLIKLYCIIRFMEYISTRIY